VVSPTTFSDEQHLPQISARSSLGSDFLSGGEDVVMRRTFVAIAIAFLAALTLAAGILAIGGTDTDNIERALRLTARFSFLLFWCAYAGGSVAAVTGRLRVLRRHGRDFGLAFAAAHSIHLLLVIWLYQIATGPLLPVPLATFFGIGLFWMYLLALFSIPSMSRLLGATIWRSIRLIGLEYIMIAFQRDFIIGTVHAVTAKQLVNYLPFAVLGLIGIGLRICGWMGLSLPSLDAEKQPWSGPVGET
jgi:hypothetical protein